MQVRTGHASGCSYETDLLTALHRISFGNERPAQMEIPGDDTAAVVDVHHVARKKEIIHQRNNTSIRSPHRCSKLSSEVHTKMPAR